MWTDSLNKLDAFLIRHHAERLLKIDDKVNYMNPTEYNAICELLYDVENYRKTLSKKKRICHANNQINTSSTR